MGMREWEKEDEKGRRGDNATRRGGEGASGREKGDKATGERELLPFRFYW